MPVRNEIKEMFPNAGHRVLAQTTGNQSEAETKKLIADFSTRIDQYDGAIPNPRSAERTGKGRPTDVQNHCPDRCPPREHASTGDDSNEQRRFTLQAHRRPLGGRHCGECQERDRGTFPAGDRLLQSGSTHSKPPSTSAAPSSAP